MRRRRFDDRSTSCTRSPRAIAPPVAAAVFLFMSGCAADRPIRLRIDDDVVRPDRSVVVFFVDGLGERQFDEALSSGRLPNVRRHLLDRGVRVRRAVAAMPSITYANAVTFITGRFPGRHGVVANKWFDPVDGRFRNYCYIKTYQWVEQDYRGSPTIYDVLGDCVTVSLQIACRRGVTHSIDNWATSGINWFFDNPTGVDCLVAQDFELIARRASSWGRWPDFIMTYFPGVDDVGHVHGPDSPRYHDAVANVDRQIGRICDALIAAGLYERTVLCLVSDHGLVQVEPERYFDVAKFVRVRTGRPVWSNSYSEPATEEAMLRQYEYAVAVTGSRWASIHAMRRADHPRTNDVTVALAAMQSAAVTPGTSGPSADGDDEAVTESWQAAPDMLPSWLREALDHPAVELLACCPQPGVMHLFRKDRHAVIVRHDHAAGVRHAVYQSHGREIVPPDDMPPRTDAGLGSDDRAWLAASADARYPDLIPQIAAMFDSPRAGDFVVFAADGWDFSPEDPRGGHGSILADDMRVPMVFAGPGIDLDRAVPSARNTDVMPTILGLLGASTSTTAGLPPMDGIDLFRSAENTGAAP